MKDSMLSMKVDYLYQGIPKIAISGSIVAAVFAFILSGHVPNIQLIIWVGFIVFFNGVRIYFYNLYKKNSKAKELETWENYYFYSAISVAGVWGLVSLIMYGHEIPQKVIIMTSVYLLGLVTGGAVSNIAHKKTAIVYSLLVFIPYVIFYLIKGNVDFGVSILGYFIFILLVFQTIKLMSKMFDDFISLAWDKELLLVEVSKKMELQKELQEEKIKTLNSSKLASLGEVTAGIAHEINNPLTVAVGRIKIVIKTLKQKGTPDDKTFKHLEDALKANERMGKIVHSMRNFSRIKIGEEFEEIKISELVSDVKYLMESRLKQGRIELIEDYEDFTFIADKSDMGQVLLNLLKNACDIIEEEKNDGWIKIISESKGGWIELEVMDSGEDLDEQIKEKLFEPFFTTKAPGKGTGLGLSLSKNIMLKNKGDLFIDPKSKNTKFVMKLKSA